jgi:aminopeptidase S
MSGFIGHSNAQSPHEDCMKKLCFSFACVLLQTTLTLAQSSANYAGDRFKNQVAAIAAGSNTSERAAAITKRLDELGVKYRLQSFSDTDKRGVNIIAELPGAGAQKLALGAHYDRVAVGQGAIDNASGCAAVLELLAAMKKKPLKNHTVTAIFFDLEEIGGVGSKAHVEADPKNLPNIYINFDVFGYGDTLWVMSSKTDSPSAKAMTQAAAESKFDLEIGPDYPPGDHLSFLKAKVETISISLIGRDEIKSILKIFGGDRSEKPPRILTIIHSAGDTPDKVDGDAVVRALPVIEQAIRYMDTNR